MRDGLLPALLLCGAYGLALSTSSGRMRWAALGLLALSTFGATFLPAQFPHLLTTDRVFLLCWSALLLTALLGLISSRMGMPQIITLIIALPIGCAAGSVLISSAARIDSIYAIAASLVCLPAGWLVKTKRRVVLNVLQGWLVAIAVLGISLPIITPTPGYAPDHKE